jgi:hypothetical protein
VLTGAVQVVDEKTMLKKYRMAIIQLKRQLLSVKDGSELSERDRAIQDLVQEKQKVMRSLVPRDEAC